MKKMAVGVMVASVTLSGCKTVSDNESGGDLLSEPEAPNYKVITSIKDMKGLPRSNNNGDLVEGNFQTTIEQTVTFDNGEPKGWLNQIRTALIDISAKSSDIAEQRVVWGNPKNTEARAVIYTKTKPVLTFVWHDYLVREPLVPREADPIDINYIIVRSPYKNELKEQLKLDFDGAQRDWPKPNSAMNNYVVTRWEIKKAPDKQQFEITGLVRGASLRRYVRMGRSQVEAGMKRSLEAQIALVCKIEGITCP